MEPIKRGENPASVTTPPSTPGRPRRLWMAVALLGLYWAAIISLRVADSEISTVFMSSVAASAVLTILFSIWWLTNRAISRRERWLSWAGLMLGGIAAGMLSDPSIGLQGIIFIGMPLALTFWGAWLFALRNGTSQARLRGLMVVMAVVWGGVLLLRTDGVDGDNNVAISGRWAVSAEDRYVQQRSTAAVETVAGEAQPVVLRDGDWAEFRGPDRQGELWGVELATNWDVAPPKELWRRSIGPAWSSVLIVDGRLFTAEQRGEQEAVIALDAATGKELWAHQDAVRFSDGQAGAGPRATPTFYQGQIYSLGATGVLNCLDAATGQRRWTRDIVADTKAALPVWGFSSSPLVTSNRVIVYSGGQPDKGLLGYDRDNGELIWTAKTGDVSYSSAQLATIDGVPQVLFFSNQGLISVDPETGTLIWDYEAAKLGIWRVDQPRLLKDGGILIGCEDLGLLRIDLSHENSQWTPVEAWRSRDLRPAYNDFVVLDDVVYGFDEGIFAAVDTKTGKRRWKQGRYGHGQVLLVGDQRILLVISESGEVVLLAADPKKHRELARFQAVTGKTWNHPVIAHGRLYIRNDQEMACFELPSVEAQREAAAPPSAAVAPDGRYNR